MSQPTPQPIRRGASRPQTRPATITQVADAAGVSRWVAGHVLNQGTGNSRVGPETANRIRDAAKRLNYHANHAAMLLRGKRSQMFGVLVASAGDPLRSFLVQYLDAEAVKVGCHTLIGNTIGNPTVGPDQFDYLVKEFSRRRVDGVLCAVHHWFEGDRRELVARHPNTIFYEDSTVPDAPCVVVDRQQAVRLAVRHLVERGRRRIGLAVMSLSRPNHLERLEGYKSELQANGLAMDERLIFNGETTGQIFARWNEETARWDFPIESMDAVIDRLVRDNGADAIVAHDDFWAAALIKRLRGRGISVPQHVAVVGYLNHYLADWTDPALTTVDLCHETAARRMIELMERIITDGPLPEAERLVKIQPRLIVRESA
jgi:DNA-binding LacI/PurR family transcriptional regulator